MYYFIVKIIALNIILGLLIDNFSESLKGMVMSSMKIVDKGGLASHLDDSKHGDSKSGDLKANAIVKKGKETGDKKERRQTREIVKEQFTEDLDKFLDIPKKQMP